MQQRVACLNPQCGAHRDRSLPGTDRCLVCGGGLYIEVPPNDADLREQIDEAFDNLMYLLQLQAALQSGPPATPVTH
jgi:hypothetical protein